MAAKNDTAPVNSEEALVSTRGDASRVNNKDGDIEACVQEARSDPKSDFPAAWFCPITKKLFIDPVVIPDGNSLERSALNGFSIVYSNRALKAIVDELVGTDRSSMPTDVQPPDSMSTGISPVFHPTLFAYYCPLTLAVMKDPVIDPEGHTFERKAIESWIKVHGVSPITRTVCSVQDLYPNNAIAALAHDSVRGWTGGTSLLDGSSDAESQDCNQTVREKARKRLSSQDAELCEARKMRCRKRLDVLTPILAILCGLVYFALIYLIVSLVKRKSES